MSALCQKLTSPVLIDHLVGGAASAIIPRRCEELQCDFRKAIFSAANKAEAVSAERNVLL